MHLEFTQALSSEQSKSLRQPTVQMKSWQSSPDRQSSSFRQIALHILVLRSHFSLARQPESDAQTG